MTEFLPLDMLLMQYAAGSLGPAESLMIAAHTALNPKARQKVLYYESLGGRLLDDESPAAVSDACLSSVLDQIGTCGTLSRHRALEDCTDRKARLKKAYPLPEPLLSLISGCCADDARCWQHLSQGLDAMNLALDDAFGGAERTLSLMKLSAGQNFSPRRRCEEIVLVIDGILAHDDARYHQGDILVLQNARATLIADDAGCLYLSLAPSRPENILQSMLSLLMRR